MRRLVQIFLLAGTVAIAGSPATASAQGFVSPWAGIVFGTDAVDSNRPAFGVAAGAANGIVGFEANFGYTPNFFDENDFDNNELDLMGNLLIGPMAGSGGYGIRPFVVGGLGLIRTSFEGTDATNDFGFNVGAGLEGYFSPHVGLRGDVRYFRTINADDVEDVDFDLGEFDFWRATIGITIH
jgi:hypothetical protein